MNLFGYRSFRRAHFGKKKTTSGSGRPKYTSKLVKLAPRPKKRPNANRAYHYARITGAAARQYIKYNPGGHAIPSPTRFVKKYYSAKKAPSGKAKMNYTYRSMGDGTYIRIDKSGIPSTAFGKKKKPSKKKPSKARKTGRLGKSFKVTFTASGVTFYDSNGKKVTKKLKKLKGKSLYSFTIRRKRGGAVYMVRGAIKRGKAGKATFHHKLR